jgi:hypothetical protein
MIILLVSHTGFARENRDFESWSSVALDYTPHKKWTLGLEGELRLNNNSSEVDQYFTQLSVDYKIFANFELGGGLRYIRNNDTQGKIQGYENHFRFHLDLSYRHRIGPLELRYRVRYQNRNELGVSPSEGDYANQHVRFKTTLIYKIKNWKLDPVFSAELFRHFEEGRETRFDKYRLTLGSGYRIKKLGKISLFYRIERTLNAFYPKTTNILMVKYTYRF